MRKKKLAMVTKPVIPILERWRQEDGEFDILGYTARMRRWG